MSTTVKSAVDQARSDAQALHKKLEDNKTHDQAAIRASLENVHSEAKKLVLSLRPVVEAMYADDRRLVTDAITSLETLAHSTKDLASASNEELKVKNQAAIDRLRIAMQKLSRAVAAQRKAISKN
ncbi:MAG: hypothetical protein JOZ50_07465 [Candidatus Eremiobacteraeota bacterium]|nr:hypothetical protein [Candidatus Eremiobacteraeota bacterium]